MGQVSSAIAAISIALAFAFAPFAHAAGGGSEPFPLDYPLPFPWDRIEGVWQIESRDYEAVFSFEVANDCNRRQILKVLQLDPETSESVSEGIGYKLSRSEQVYAAMSGAAGSYMLYVGAYEDTHSIPAKRAYVLRVVPFNAASSELRFKIKKISSKVPRSASSGDVVACLD